jgi:hypothetical protein
MGDQTGRHTGCVKGAILLRPTPPGHADLCGDFLSHSHNDLHSPVRLRTQHTWFNLQASRDWRS